MREMQRFLKISLLIALLFFIQAHGIWAAEQTRIFQQGVNVYTGVADTWVSSEDWDTPPQYSLNYGQNDTLQLSRDGGDNPLIHFNLEEIPPNSAVISAELSLYNETPSSSSGAKDFARRINLFRVLKSWNENEATGDNASVGKPWAERGMQAGGDYDGKLETLVDVINEGWYKWDITALAQAWVHGDYPNYGIVLRDATGYEDDHVDWRTFLSSQHTDVGKRPMLKVTYNPDVPLAHAGEDQENLQWKGGAITLDGSGSHDRPGGNDATLQYQWRIVSPAFGSAMANHVLTGKTALFFPDIPGEWEIELTVTNEQGESATDTARLWLLNISDIHPRIYLTPSSLAELKTRAIGANLRWTQLKDYADADDDNMHADALVYQITGQASYGNQAVNQALSMIAESNDWSTKAGEIAVVYDWCYSLLTASQKNLFLNYFNAWADDLPKSQDVPGWGNYWPRYGYSYAHIGLAAYGDTPRAKEWLEEYRHNRYGMNDIPLLNHIADGGAWPEGMIYDSIANLPKIKAVEAWRTGTGENLFESSTWYRNRTGYLLLHHLPGLADKQEWETDYHGYISTGDSERNRGSLINYERIMGLLLVGRFPEAPSSGQLMAYLSSPPTDHSNEFLYHEEFLWFDPNIAIQSPDLLTHYSPATGTVFIRSDWRSGAADTDSGETYITFQCGDHFTYHQHYDQNSFTLFKHGDLAVDSGVYSGDGLSWHDVNYYVRTIAHNTLVVYNPDEDFSSARPDAQSNDGGQRSLYPASRSPNSIDYFNQHITHYDTGDMKRFEDTPQYTYALGDATKAYNNPDYNQAADTGLDGNVAKVTRFQRELVYLRPTDNDDSDFLVLFDRVGVTRPSFSGEHTKLLFHTLNEPTLNGTPSQVSPGEILYQGADSASAVSGDGKLFIKFLSPANIRKVGGRGEKAFWVFGENYDWHWASDEPQPRPTNDFEEKPYGEWRLEMEPVDTGLDHYFLTILQPCTANILQMREITRIDGTGLTGAFIAGPLNRAVLFSSALDGETPAGTISYSYPSISRTLNLIFDLTPGSSYRINVDTNGGQQSVALIPDVGGIYTATAQGVLKLILPEIEAVPGDVNGDGSLTIADAVAALKILANLETTVNLSADVNHNGKIGLEEAVYILEKLTSLR
jgi:hypothetical protein